MFEHTLTQALSLKYICILVDHFPKYGRPTFLYLRILNIFSKRQILFKLFYLFQRLQWTDNCFFKINFVFFLYLLCQHHERKTICLDIHCISVIRQTVGTEHKHLFCRFLDVSILQLLIIYRIYDYVMLTLSQ